MVCLKHEVPLIMGTDVVEAWVTHDEAVRVLLGQCPVCHRVFSVQQTVDVDWEAATNDEPMEI